MITLKTERGTRKKPRSIDDVVKPLNRLAHRSNDLFAAPLTFGMTPFQAFLPKYLFVGPGDRGNALRVGIFAGLHGDEESGILAVAEFIARLCREPERARGYELFFFPLCNPGGYLQGTRHNPAGIDLNREFWRGSEQPEVWLLEGQLRQLRFDGLIALHSDDSSEGLYGFVKGHELTRHVLDPALEAASQILPRNYDRSIDNFEANNGIIVQGYPGILSAPEQQKPQPFEIVFETPHLAPLDLQIEAHITAMQTILDRYKVLISEAQNI